MSKKILSLLLSILLVLGSISAFVGCNESEKPNETESGKPTVTEKETEVDSQDPNETDPDNVGESESSGGNEDVTEPTGETEGNDDLLYGNGDEIEYAGIAWDKDAFALLDYTVDESAARDISAAELLTILNSETAQEGAVYRVNEPLILESGMDYDGNFASVIATEGVIIKNANDIVVRELIVKGDVSIEGSSEIVLFNVDIQGGSCALSIDGACEGIAIKGCKISATDLCISVAGKTLTVFETKLEAKVGISSTGDETAIHGCHFINETNAVTCEGVSCIVRNNTIELGDASGVGVDFKAGSYNSLIALNRITGVQQSIRLDGGYNCAIILNSAITLTANNTTNVYVIENELGGVLELLNNDYVICDGNDSDSISESNNSNVNGNNLTDVNARVEVGANEEITPHTNKELFVGMERRTKVLDAAFTKQYTLNQYIRNNSKSSDIVIVPPGAYSSASAISLGSTHSNTVVYAYGVYEEFSQRDVLLAVSGANGIEFRGLTMGYNFLSGGQIDLISKDGKNFIAVTSAGWDNGYGKTDPSKYSTGFTEIYTDGNIYPWAAIGSNYSIEHNPDGTMSLTINDASIAGKTGVGDSMTCRYAGANQSTLRVTDSSDVKFLDCVLYGFSNSLAVVASGNTAGMSLERFHNTTQPAPIIDKETYERYVALGERYGVDLGVYIDDSGRYRGATPLQGSTDATHIMGATEGVDVTSSIFEGMTDDGSNQRASSARLHKIEINGNVATIYYKGLMAPHYEGSSTGSCSKFEPGDKIKVYSARGEILCETFVTSASEHVEVINIAGTSVSTNVYKVNVSASALDKEILEIINTQYDLSDNSSSTENRVMVDNLSHNCVGFTFDNVIIRNTRSRGILVKTTDVTIKHCTFQNLAHTGIVICVEPDWGESTAASNVNVLKCVFDNTGAICDYLTRVDLVPIYIGTGSETVKENTLPYKNITIDGCKFLNNKSRYAITAHSTQNLTIVNNTFCEIVDESVMRFPVSIYIQKSMNVTISGNTFTPNLKDQSITKIVKITSSKNILGSDTVDADGNTLFPDTAE